jgi:class 3 adenylate cyclase
VIEHVGAHEAAAAERGNDQRGDARPEADWAPDPFSRLGRRVGGQELARGSFAPEAVVQPFADLEGSARPPNAEALSLTRVGSRRELGVPSA